MSLNDLSVPRSALGVIEGEVIYDAEPQLSHPSRFFGSLVTDLRRSAWLAGELLKQSLRAKYRTSVLGYFWLFAPPLAIAGVWIFLHRSGIVSLGHTTAPYPVHVIAGLFLWTGFLRMLNAPLQQLAASRHLLAKISFPWEALLLAGWGEALVEFAVFLVVLMGVLAAFGMDPVVSVLRAMPSTAALLLLGCALGLLLTPIGLLYEDVPRAIGIVMYGLFFLTPVIYPPPSTMPGLLTLEVNPIGILLVTSREVMTSSPVTHLQLTMFAAAGAIVLFLISWIIFRLSVPHLVSKL